jgi:DNA-binding MarR family transcriptional regulator
MGYHGSESPTVSELADCLLLRHHSTVELVNRAEAAGFVRRSADPRDGRLVRVALTEYGERLLTRLTPAHLVQLHSLATVLDGLVADAGG